MEISIKMDNKRLMDALTRAPVEMKRELTIGIRKAGRVLQVEVVKNPNHRNHRYNTQSGNLNRSIKVKVDSPLSGYVYADEGTAPYAKFIHDGWGTTGTKSVIGKGKNLLFGMNRKVKGKQMRGWKKDPFMSQALEDKREECVAIMKDSIDTALRNVGA